MKFQVGESVICIDDSFTWARQYYRKYNVTWPVCGRVYVVRGYAIKGSHPALLLRDVKNPNVPYRDGTMREAGFWEERFERAPDLGDLRKIADDVSRWLSDGGLKHKETEDA